jgi:hypothetical protein
VTTLTIRCFSCDATFRAESPRAGRRVFPCPRCAVPNAVRVAPQILRGSPDASDSPKRDDETIDAIRRAYWRHLRQFPDAKDYRPTLADVRALLDQIDALARVIADLGEEGRAAHDLIRADERERILAAAPAISRPLLRRLMAHARGRE